MNTLEELLGVDPTSPSMLRATQLVENDRALLRGLVQLRTDKGLTQQEVADRMGVTQPTVAKFESYDANPTLATIRRYAHAVEALVTHNIAADRGQPQDPARGPEAGQSNPRDPQKQGEFRMETAGTP